MTRRVYIAGPMTGIPEYNAPAFRRARARWESAAWLVTTPLDTNSLVWLRRHARPFDPARDRCDYGDPALGEMWAENVKAITRADAVAFLPGWRGSKGATAEHAIAVAFGKELLDGETMRPLEVPAPAEKPTNPKDAVGSDKLPLHLWPTTATAVGCLPMLEGALKYGRSNFRAIGVRASIYYDACRRHLDAWFEGEDDAPDSGIPHLGHALACLAIIVDAGAAGKLTDDRMVPGGYLATRDALTAHVARLKALHAGKQPKHYTIADQPE